MTPKLQNRRHAFTLIELLTVIALIAILMAILIPVVGRMRAAAQSSDCLSTLRQWGIILQLYAQDNQGGAPNPWLPPHEDNNTDTAIAWTGPLVAGGYVPQPEAYEMLVCPTTDTVAGNGTTCYGMNRRLAAWNERHWYVRNMINPTRTIVLGDGGINPNWGVDRQGSAGATISHPDEASRDWDTLGFREIGNTANVLFADGHVEALTREEVTLQMFYPYTVVSAD